MPSPSSRTGEAAGSLRGKCRPVAPRAGCCARFGRAPEVVEVVKLDRQAAIGQQGISRGRRRRLLRDHEPKLHGLARRDALYADDLQDRFTLSSPRGRQADLDPAPRSALYPCRRRRWNRHQHASFPRPQADRPRRPRAPAPPRALLQKAGRRPTAKRWWFRSWPARRRFETWLSYRRTTRGATARLSSRAGRAGRETQTPDRSPGERGGRRGARRERSCAAVGPERHSSRSPRSARRRWRRIARAPGECEAAKCDGRGRRTAQKAARPHRHALDTPRPQRVGQRDRDLRRFAAGGALELALDLLFVESQLGELVKSVERPLETLGRASNAADLPGRAPVRSWWRSTSSSISPCAVSSGAMSAPPPARSVQLKSRRAGGEVRSEVLARTLGRLL